MKIKKPFFLHNLYVDSHGLHLIGFLNNRNGYQLAYLEHVRFAKTQPGQGSLQEMRTSANLSQTAQAPSSITEWIKTPEVKLQVQEILRKAPLKQAHIGICFSEAFSVFRFFTMPVVEKIYRKKAIPIEARKHIPFPLEECLYDWKCVEFDIKDKEVLGVLFAAVRRDVFDAASTLCLNLGLRPAFVESQPIAISRAVEHVIRTNLSNISITKETLLAIYIDPSQIQMTLFAKTLPVLSRSVYLTDTAVRGSFILERRKLDLEATLNFIKRQLGLDHVDRVVILGASGVDRENLNTWSSGLSEEMGVKVEVIEKLLTAFVGMDNKPVFLSAWSELVGFGVALRGISRMLDEQELDLIVSLTEEPAAKAAVRMVWSAVGVAGLLFTSLSLWRLMDIYSLKEKLAVVRLDEETNRTELRGMGVSQIKTLVSRRVVEVKIMQPLVDPSSRLYLTPILTELANRTPQELWLEGAKFNFNMARADSMERGGDFVRSITLSWHGRVYALDGQKDFALVSNFFRTMKNHPALIRWFSKADFSVKKREMNTVSSWGNRQGESVERPTLNFVMGFNTTNDDLTGQ